jgi:hypothetical protein
MAKNQIKNYVFKPGIGANDNRYPNAYAILSANKSFIQKEATAWIQDQVDAAATGFIGYTYNQAKCERDVGYVVDAYLKDLRYGGNENVRKTIKYYWDQDVAQVDGDRQPEIQTHTFLGNLIKDYIFTKAAYSASNTEVTQTVSGNAAESIAQFTPTGATYTPTTGNMTLTIGSHTLAIGDEIFIAPGGITFTCALDGNVSLHPYPRASGVPNSTGKDPYYYAPISITATTATTVTVNVGISSDTSVHTFNSAVTNSVTAGPAAKINTLVFNTVDVITNGLTAQPKAIPTGVGTVKIQGKFDTNELLLITNTSKSEIIYSFSNPATGGTVSILDNTLASNTDSDFVSYLETTDGVTTISLNYNTSTHSNTDDLQIFVEEKEVRIRPYDFGTDAIERMRIAPPMSMLDADFEYGLQPTKWSAIGTLRGYPSVYEIPGTDTSVLSVVTDASTGSEGIGQSLITVTTVSAHGFEVGSPITIKALENSISGAARAEGSFVIEAVPSNNVFTFYAKAKVGVANGEILSTTYTQLRQAGFYTGASIGQPTFGISSNGSSGTMFAQLNVAEGSSIIPFDGPSPEIGSPLTNAKIPLGSQVTGINDTSAGGGTYITPAITQDVLTGENRVYIEDVAGIVTNLAADRGDGTAINVATIGADYLDFDGNFTTGLVANKKTYASIAGINQSPSGINATFDIGLTGNPSRDYTVAINAAGTGYAIGDRIIIDGILVGGQSTTNNVNITVTGIDVTGAITTLSFTGVHWDGTLSLTGVSATNNGGTGTGAIFDLNYSSGAYTTIVPASGIVQYDNPAGVSSGVGFGATYSVSRNGTTYNLSINGGSGYAISDTIVVPGNNLGGTTPANDATITIDTIDGSGGILTASITGTGNDTSDASTGYTVNDRIKILGSTVGGVDEFNDVYLTVSSIGGSGNITAVTFVGTPPGINNTYNNVGSQIPYSYSGSSGQFATFSITNSGGTYAVTVVTGGQDYLPTETFVVPGSYLGGISPTNDATITIDNVGGTGDITAASVSGAGTTAATQQDIIGTNLQGSGATFDISISGGAYVVSINSAGANYGAGQTLKVIGSTLSGTSPANDLTISITTVDGTTTGAITVIGSSGTPATAGGTYTNIPGTNDPANGVDATFSVARNFSIYDTISASVPGTGYKIGDRIVISGTDLDGVSPANDISVTVNTIGAIGEIETITTSYISAEYGSNLDLISTVLITDPTTAPIAVDEAITYAALATLEITFSTPHGLVPGDSFITAISSADGTNNHALAGGSFFATAIPTIYTLRYTARTAGAINTSLTGITGTVYPRPDSFFVHRPFDGGVQLGTGGPQHGAQAIRQSKKYIRYQSGKGIMYTTGALFAPSYDLRSVTADGIEVGSLITIETDDNDHGVQVGGIIRLLGVQTPGYNSGGETAVPPRFDYEVVDVVNERTFKVRSQRRLGSTTGELGFAAQMSVVSWHGATVRSGIFDDQNGIFWEYDGTNISVNQRTGTKQVAGTIAIGVDSNSITGSNTRFRDQVKAGDRVVIKGMTHVVTNVMSNSELSVSPDWRGVVSITGAKMNLVVDKKTKQRDFNLDRLDGTGPSGYEIDIAKMQMIGIQYSWYGAGFIDFMLRGSDGNFVFCHRMRNSNVNTEAFMRSGNLPVRYEVTNEGPPGRLSASMTDSQTTVPLDDASFFPDFGIVYIDNEVISFTGKSGNNLTGCVRSATFSNFQAGADRVYTAGPAAIHDQRTGVILISNTITPLISHWGSAFLTDGGFDEDRGYIFSYAATGVEISTSKNTAFMIRLAPSVSNAIVGDLGERELLNRAQLLLQGLEITSDPLGASDTGGIVIQGVLNPQNYPTDPGSVTWSGLSGVAQGGQPSFAQIAPGGAIQWSTGGLTTTSVTSSGNIDTATYTPLVNGTSENSSPIEIQTSIYSAIGAVFVGADIYSVNPSNAYTGGSQGTYRVTNIRTSGSQTLIDFRSTTGRTTKAANWTGTPGVFFRQPAYTGFTNRLIFAKAAWDAVGASAGTAVAVSDTNWPAGTAVSNVTLKSLGGIEFYEVVFNQTATSSLSSGASVTFEFGEAASATPGETVFSFIATAGERSTLNLSELKELTNTPLGGRGTFPNGPDILAINVYKISGDPVNANIILRWGEAQA